MKTPSGDGVNWTQQSLDGQRRRGCPGPTAIKAGASIALRLIVDGTLAPVMIDSDSQKAVSEPVVFEFKLCKHVGSVLILYSAPEVVAEQ